MAESLQIDVKEESNTNSSVRTHGMTDRFDQKVTSLERIFLITNFFLELPSAVFDQLSSVHRPQYALLNMVTSFAVMILSITDLVFKGRKARIAWMKKGLIPWFYYPYPNSKPFGNFADVIGLVCAIFQWIFSSIAYVFLSRNVDNPIKISTWPLVFAFGLLYSRLSENHLQKSVSNLRKLSRAEEFSLTELAAATNDFSDHNKLGEGRFGIVYKGRLPDGREVVIKRNNTNQPKESEEKDSTFEYDLTYLLRLHHRNLVGLLGYCEEGAERFIIYNYMKNGSLYNQLFHKNSSVIDSWVMRIKIALDAAKGIDYLHNYAVPTLIHRSIESSSILLDANWMAKVSDFGLEIMGVESIRGYKSKKVEATAGYVDPEYYALNILTTKSDVYSFGVVLLELLTGKTSLFKDSENQGALTSLVDYAIPKILQNQYFQVLDSRIGLPKSGNEAEAVEMVAYTALHCVNSEGINRPNITNIVVNLEQALSLVNDSSRILNAGKLQNSYLS